jgi:thiol-disulfide isomerase/thioredoxin
MFGCNQPVNKKEYLTKVYHKLNKIHSASYSIQKESWAPFDTVPSFVYNLHAIEIDNPSDTTIGACYVSFTEDKSNVKSIYDGQMSATFFHEHQGVIIDSFKIDRGLEFRPLSAPFFNYTRSIIHYILNTEDSISISFEHTDSAYYYRLNIFEDQQVEFFGSAYRMPENPYNFGETTSQYELWIDKKTNLPYRVRRKMSHDISVSSVSEVEINTHSLEDFNAGDYLPDDYEYREWGVDTKKAKQEPIKGEVAPDWMLRSTDNTDISLNELDSKLILLQFTSVSCGPCRVSVPFLNGLLDEYSNEQLAVIAIECTAKSVRAIKHYREVNEIKYPLLKSNDEVKENYQVSSFPVFYLMDENREVVHVSKGYAEGTTDEKLKKIIHQYI